jgi:ribulose-bisphosphate carboxylase large chain
MSPDRLLATYLVETPHSLEHAATVIAGEQSSGTFVAVPGETVELKERFGARVERITSLETSDSPALPGSKPPRGGGTPRYRRGVAEISFPLHNTGPSLAALVSTVAGNLYELQEVSGLRLLDLDLPPAFAAHYPGPAFGVAGTRRLAGVPRRALIGTIVKPSIGLSLDQLRPLVRELATAGLDFIKDDEIHCDPPYAPLADRVAAVMDELKRAADATGRLAMYAFNVSGDIDHMLRGADLVQRAGGTCVMVNVNAVGLPAVAHLRRHCALPIHGHRAGYGAMARAPLLGMSFTAWQKLARLAGVDHLHVGGMSGKFHETNEEVARSIRDCLAPLFGDYRAVPVISSAQWAGSAHEILAATGAVDVLHLAGGGIIAHPGGIAAGVRSMQQGWEAAVAGVSLAEYARGRPELRAAIDKFGGRA